VSDTSLHSGIPTLYTVACRHVSASRESDQNSRTERKIRILESHNYFMRFLFFDSVIYRGADKSLAQPTSRCVLLDGDNISFDASLVICRVSQEECAILRESVPYVKLYRHNPKHLYPKLNGYGDNAQRSLKL
jgi:hypothetical protein